MIRQRNQFDTHRTQATAATPTCCCCCCCLVALESSTAIVAQTAYLKGKETNNSLKWIFVALGILMWPIVALTTTVSIFATDAIIPTRYANDGYGYGYYEESSDIPGWIGLGTAIVTLIAILYIVYKFSGLRNPEISVLISIPAFVAFFALEFGVSLFVLLGGVASFEEFDSAPILIGFYFLLTTSMSVGLTYLARVVFINNQKKRFLRAGAPQYQPPQYPPGQPPSPPQAPPQY